MNRNTVAFFASVALLFIGYFYLTQQYATQQPLPLNTSTGPAAIVPETVTSAVAPMTPPPPLADSGAPGASSNPAVAAPQAEAFVPAKLEDLRMDFPLADVEFSPLGGCIKSYRLKKHKETLKEGLPAELYSSYAVCKSFGFRIGALDLRADPVSASRPDANTLVLTQRTKDFELRRVFKFNPESYAGNMEVEVKNIGPAQQNTSIGFELGATSEHKESGSLLGGMQLEQREILYHFEDSVHREHLPFEDTPAREEILRKQAFAPDWFGSDSLYFLSAVLPQTREPVDLSVTRTGFNIQKSRTTAADRTVYEAWADTPVSLAPGASKTYSYDLYLGPKVKENLDNFGTRGLPKAIDFGLFRIVAWPLFYAIDFLQNLFGNWGVAIIVLTLAIKILFYPLTARAYIAGRKMQKIQPELNALKEKLKDDKQKQQQEMMALMGRKGVNPMSGCLPILPQIPVFFGLNAVLIGTFELRHAPFYFWLQDLSDRDPYFISPLLMAGLMYAQQKITPLPTMDPNQARMMQILPLVFALFMLSYPSGLVLYIITNTAVSILQQQFMMRRHKDI